MAGRIPQHFIDELLARTDIVDIIDTYVPLRKAGKNHQALCPFHDEKSPSFTVSQDKQFYHCFGCGANGTAISFLMDYNHLGFIEAVEELANRAGLNIPREAGQPVKNEGFTELYELMEMVVDFYRKQLKEHVHADRAVNYLKQRGLTGELAAGFELGYAPAGWDSLLKHFGQSEAARQRLERIGMIIERDSGGYYDRFRDRIMFPIRDQRGRAIGFGGRVIDDNDTPKYLNTPETPIFHKGRELYGLYQARRKHKELERLLVVEGYMDVLALSQKGIDNAVATLGTAATTDHLERIFRNTGQLVFCFDGDDAGQKAAARAMETALPLLRDGRQVFFMFMPRGEDPDSLVRKQGRTLFENTDNCLPLSDYLINALKEQNDLSTREGRSGMVEQSLPYLSKLPQGVLRQMILRDIATVTRIPVEDIEPLIKRGTPPPGRAAPRARYQDQMMTPVSHLISMILHRPELALLVDEPGEITDLPDPGAPFLRELVEFVHNRPNITCAGIIENWRDSKYEARLRELAAKSDVLLSELDDLEQELLDTMERLKAKKRKQDRKKSTTVSRMSELTDEGKAELRKLVSSRNLPSEK